MRRRRVPVLRLGSRGPGGDARLLRLWTQAFAIVRNRSQPFAIVRNRSRCVGLAGETKIVAKRRTTFRVSKVSIVTGIGGGRGRETQNCRHFWTRLGSSRLKSVNSHRDRGGGGRETQNCRHFWIRLGSSRFKSVNSHKRVRGVVVAKLRIVVTFGLVSGLRWSSRLKSVNSHGDRGGWWSRNAELSSLLDSSRVFDGLRVSKVSTVTGIGGVVVAKRRTVVTFGLVSGLRWSSRLKSVNRKGDRGGGGRKTQNCRHFWTRLGSSRLNSVNSHKRVGGGWWSRSPELSSLLDSSRVFDGLRVSTVSTVTGIGGVVVAKPRTVVTFGLVPGLRISKVSTVTGIGGVVVAKRSSSRFKSVNSHKRVGGGGGRETQNCRHFWTRPGSSHLKNVNSHGDRGGGGRKTQKCRHFWTRLGSSRLKSVDSHRGRGGRGGETQNCGHFWIRLGSSRFKSVNSHKRVGGVVVAKLRIVVTFGLVSGLRWSSLRVSKVSTVTGIGGVVVAKRRTVVTFGLVSGLRWSSRLKSVNSHGDRGGGGRKTQNCRHFWTRLGSSMVFASQKCQQSRGSGGWWSQNAELSSLLALPLESEERRGEKREERRDARREERRETRGKSGKGREERREERREKRGEKREEKGEERGERREERTVDRREERGERRGEERREERQERTQDRGWKRERRGERG